jgi:hypothetical protein
VDRVTATPLLTGDPWDAIVAAFQQLHYQPDIYAIEATYAAVAAHRLPGQPVWIFGVAPPSSGKTEMLMPLLEAQATIISNVTPKTFISGWSNERTGEDASLLTRIGNRVIVCKDFSQVLAMPRPQRGPVLADLRDIYDGHIAKEYGTGDRREWRGRITFIAGVTPEIDRHYAIFQSLGERFVQVRWKRPGGVEAALRAMADESPESRERVRVAVQALFRPIISREQHPNPSLSDADRHTIANLAEFTVIARTHVSRDGKTREMNYVPDAEASPRLAQQLSQLARGAALLHGRGEVNAADITLTRRVALDCIPTARRQVLSCLISQRTTVSNQLITAYTHLNKTMVGRQLEELEGLRFVNRTGAEDFSEASCILSDEAYELVHAGFNS